MKYETTITICLSQEENEAWDSLFLAVRSLAFTPCEDVKTAEAVNDFYNAMLKFADYL